MRTIYKYILSIEDTQKIEIPFDSLILSAKIQNNIICIWAVVDTDNPIIERKVVICGTGHRFEYKEPLKFIDTVLLHNDKIVFHIFIEEENGLYKIKEVS